jgi:thioredoxin-related protein
VACAKVGLTDGAGAGCLWQAMFGSTLYKDGVGEVGTNASLKDKPHVAIFFGAAWSGSCKQFMQPLVQVYKKLTEELGKPLEIVYVPATVPGRPAEDEASYKELMAQMPWLGVPHHRKATHKKLTRRFQVRQIPMLVLLDVDGKTIHRDITPAVTHIVEDGKGNEFANEFPWAEKRHNNIKQMLGESFVKGDGSEVKIGDLEGKYIGILFSANWHWSCRRFTQMVQDMYDVLQRQSKEFEIIDMVRPLVPSPVVPSLVASSAAWWFLPTDGVSSDASGLRGGHAVARDAGESIRRETEAGRVLPCRAVPHVRHHRPRGQRCYHGRHRDRFQGSGR